MKLLYVANGENYRSYKDQIVNSKRSAYHFERSKIYVDIISFALMPNHFHIYIHTRAPGAGNEISSFMRKLCQSYTQYFNSKYQRTGALFEGRFKVEHVSEENHSKYLFAYISLNPMKLLQPDWKEKGVQKISEAKKFLASYQYSSFIDILNSEKNMERLESRILDIPTLQKMFELNEKLSDKIFDWIKDNHK
jgi:REP element-mobilizing transposase RayT